MTAPIMNRALSELEAADRRARRRRRLDRAVPYLVAGAGALFALAFAAFVAVLLSESS